MAKTAINKQKNKGILQQAPIEWDAWLEFFFPRYVPAPFGRRHVDLWEWLESLQPGIRPRPFVGIWPRGGAKSQTAELGVVRLGARNARHYVWYISETQDQADKHVDSIEPILGNEFLGRYYPKLASRAVGKYGSSKGWRRSRLRTASGLTVDALGLDTAGRGLKVEEQRPDLIILDDIDDKFDSATMALKKLGIISASILAAGSNDCAVLFIQNLINIDSIASRLVDGRADILADKILSGPFKAVDGLEYKTVNGITTITGGTPTWAGQDMSVCQSNINTWGLSAFLQEAQQEVENVGGMWAHVDFQHREWAELPRFSKVVVWLDPAVTSTDQSDSQGICAGALGIDMKKYMLYAWEGILDPEKAVEKAIYKGLELGAGHIGIETDQGGDTWKTVYDAACDKIKQESGQREFPIFKADKAGAGYGPKGQRNQKMMADYDRGNVIHAIGTHGTLERSLRRFPVKPLDLADAEFWVWNDLENYGPTDQDMKDYGADVIKEEEITDDMISYHADTYGMTYEEAKKDMLKERIR
jgi:hypothetical protein